MLDSNALADLIAELVGEHVDRATAPLLTRIAGLEARLTAAPSDPRLESVERGLASVAEQAAVIEQRLAALPAPVDGKDADMDQVRNMLSELVAAIPVPKDGAPGRDGRDGLGVEDISVRQDGALVEFSFTVGDIQSTYELELPAGPEGQRGPEGPAGRDGRDGVDGRDGERGLEGAAGKLGVARAWSDGVHYEGDVVVHAGATWQALRDSGREPSEPDWICLAARGGDGRDAAEFEIRGTWSDAETYSRLNVVALNGASFVARRDDPGPCPGDGWQLMSAQGKRGAPGERGVSVKGDRGDAGQPVVAAGVDDAGMITLVNGDGSTVSCDLYPVLSKVMG
ncbi:MAG: hypothetical protein ACOYM5_02780 [Caulobacter sp.]